MMQNMEQPSQQERISHDYNGYQPFSSSSADEPFLAYDRSQPPYSPETFIHGQPYPPYQVPVSPDLQGAMPGNIQQNTLPAALCYVGFWLSGFLFLLFEKKDRFVRFHAMQSLLFFGAVNVLYIVFISIMSGQVPFLFGFAIFAFVVMNVVAVVAWFVGLIGALQGRYVKLPFVGEIAERFASNTLPLK